MTRAPASTRTVSVDCQGIQSIGDRSGGVDAFIANSLTNDNHVRQGVVRQPHRHVLRGRVHDTGGASRGSVTLP